MVERWSAVSWEEMGILCTFSCYHRLGYLETPAARDLFEEALGRMSYCYEFEVITVSW